MFFTLIDSTFKLYAIDYNKLIITLILVLSLIGLYLFYSFKYLWLSVFLVLLIPRPFYIIKNYKIFYETTRGFIESLITNQYIVEEYTKHFILLTSMAIPLIAGIFFYSVIKKKHTLPILITGCIIFTVYYYLGSDVLFRNASIFLSICLVLYSFNQYMVMKDRLGTEEAEIRSNYFKRLMSFSIILVILVSFITRILPYDFKPVSYEWVDKNVISKFENIKGRGDRTLSQKSFKSAFNLSYTGFQPDPKRLGGPIKINNALALRVVTDEKDKEIHLRGSIKDSYTGELWEKSENTAQRYDSLFDSGDWASGYSVKSITVFHEGIQTSTAFNILHPQSVNNSYNYIFVDSEGEVFNPNVIKKGRSYEVGYRDYNISRENNSRLKESKDIKNKEEFDKYLRLPNLSERVYSLTEEITEKYDTPYEKASAIEEFLKNKYTYDRNTSNLPEGREFVDYFLFDEKKGYCTYYATAMAVMCRIANIPSRYVEGFTVNAGKSEKNSVDVLNSDAHAWVELYFSNAGWVAFDPTPGHDSPAMLLVSNTDNQGNPQNPGETSNNEKPNQQEKPSNNNHQNESDSAEDTKDYKAPAVLGYALVIAGIAAALILIYLIVNKLRYKDTSIGNLIKLVTLYGSYAQIPIHSGETIREYLVRLGQELNIESKTKDIIIFEDSLYGGKPLKNEDIVYIRDMIQGIKQRTMSRIGKYRFFILDFSSMLMFWKS